MGSSPPALPWCGVRNLDPNRANAILFQACGWRLGLKSLLRNLYFRLSSPLLARVNLLIDSRLNQECSERAAGIQVLESRIEELEKRLAEQAAYTSKLESGGLNRMLADYSTEGLRSPSSITKALIDVISGTEPQFAARKHNLPVEDLVAVREALSSATTATPSSLNFDTFDRDIVLELCEKQLEFNEQWHSDLRSVLQIENARLRVELELARTPAPSPAHSG
jgi:hypothetical protein